MIVTHSPHYILTLSCQDVRGIVAAVTGFLSDQFGFIIESAQFGDESTGRFFLRIEFTVEEGGPDEERLKRQFTQDVAQRFGMEWRIVPKQRKSRVLIMVSKDGHCLNDLLYRHATGQLAIEIPAIVSNHRDWEQVAKWYNIPYYYLPLFPASASPSLTLPRTREREEGSATREREEGSAAWGVEEGGAAREKDEWAAVMSKAEQEAKVLSLAEEHAIDVVVLARYMQILSPAMCEALKGRAINIHHSFLPSFKGARPYQQAYDRGVKLIGATAHYVTTDLDEGPIIEQEVARVDHTQAPADLAAIGRDIECLVLARALKYHSEHRVLLNGAKTVVFR